MEREKSTNASPKLDGMINKSDTARKVLVVKTERNNGSLDADILGLPEAPKKSVKYESRETIEEDNEEIITISDEQIDRAIGIYEEYTNHRCLKVDMDNIDENKIPLKGDAKILCLICKETHEDDDCQYLIVKDNNKIIFDCICKKSDDISIILSKRPKKTKITKFPSDDLSYRLIQKNTPKSHAKIFCKAIKGKCFTVVENLIATIWIANDCNLWEKKPKQIVLKIIEDTIINFIKTWTERKRKIWDSKLKYLKEDDLDEKKLNDEITSLTWHNAVNRYNSRTWVKQVMECIITELMDNDREKLMNRTRGEIACPPCHVLVLETGRIRGRKPEDNWTIELPVSYISKEDLNKEKYEIWKTFIRQITLVDKIPENKAPLHNLRNICGSILLGHGSNRVLTVIEGESDSGKDILFEAIECVMGKFAAKGSKKAFQTDKEIIEKVPDIDAIRSARYLRISDLTSRGKLNNDYIEEIIKGKEIIVKGPKRETTTIIPLYRLILTSEDELTLDNKILKRTYILN